MEVIGTPHTIGRPMATLTLDITRADMSTTPMELGMAMGMGTAMGSDMELGMAMGMGMAMGSDMAFWDITTDIEPRLAVARSHGAPMTAVLPGGRLFGFLKEEGPNSDRGSKEQAVSCCHAFPG